MELRMKANMSVGHHGVLALWENHKAGFLEGTDSLFLADAGNLWHWVRR